MNRIRNYINSDVCLVTGMLSSRIDEKIRQGEGNSGFERMFGGGEKVEKKNNK